MQSHSPLLINTYLSNNPAGKANDSAPKVPAATGGTTSQKVLDGFQLALDLVGLIPGAGEVADGLNALISLARGNYVDAALSAASMIPFAGWAAAAGKGARYTAKAIDAAGTAAKYSDELVDMGRYVAKYADEAVDAGRYAGEAVDAVQYADEAADGAKYFSDVLNERAGEISTTKPFNLNSTHSKTLSNKEFGTLVDDIKVNGINEPIKYVKYNGEMYVVDGHHRLLAAKKLGLTDIPIEEVTLPYKGYKAYTDLFWGN